VNLNQGLDNPWAGHYSSTFGPLVVGDVIVIAGNGGGGGDSAPEDVRGFDARTGRRLWTFHVMSRPGEFGNETWPEDAWTVEGAMGS